MAVAICLPATTWTFVIQPSRFGDISIRAPQKHQQLEQHQYNYASKLTFQHQRAAFCPLLAKVDDDDEDAEWEPDEDDLMGEELDVEDLDDEFDLDDVENSVTGATDDDYDEDDIDYEDDEDIEEEESDEDEFDEDEDDEGIDEEDEDDDIDEEDDADDYDIDDMDSDDLDAMLQSGGMTEKPPEGYSKWWEDYGFESREDFENHELFPGGMAGLMAKEEPDDDFWDDDVTMVPLMEDPENAEYNDNLKKILASSQKRKAAAAIAAKEEEESLLHKLTFDDEDPFNEFDIMGEMSEALDRAIPGDGDEEEATLTREDLEDIDINKEMLASPALFDDEPYIGANRTNIAGTGVTDEEMEALDRSWKNINEAAAKEPWNKVEATQYDFEYDKYPKQYHYDMQQTAVEIGSASYNVYPWLKYDMGFNVSNLVLASVQHNPDAPVILQHWYPQLMVCERYQHARDRNFDFTWEDVENANITELEEYYMGFGYDEIPKKVQSETGMISFEETDEQETKMAMMEKWMLDVYNSEWDRKDFDDEDIKDEDNVFSDNFVMPAHPDLPDWDDAQEDIAAWRTEFDEGMDGMDEETKKKNIEYRDSMGKSVDFTSVQDEDFQKNFRGHLVVACGNYEEDLDVAERITERMEKEFGNAIYTETKIYQQAAPEDNVFEVWLESYEIDLLHSKRRASMGVDGWEGFEEVDDDRMDYLVKEITKLTSDDARNSLRWSEEHVS